MQSSVHDSYSEQRKGRFSRNPIIFILDFLCLRFTAHDGTPCTVLLFLCALIFAFNIFGYFIFAEKGIDTTWLFYVGLIPASGIDYLYRYLRHRYIKQHDLPGPYGWGTLDCEE